jgi:hypothetical protein
MFRVGTRRPTVSRTEGQHLVPLKHLLRTKHQSDDACYAVSSNLIFPINYLSDIPYHGKTLLWQWAANFLCMRSSLLKSIVVTEFQGTEIYSSLDLTQAKYNTSRLPKVEKEKVIV